MSWCQPSFVLVTVLLVFGNAMADPCDGGTSNGCSTLFPDFPYKSTFRPACNRHDVCYGCGVKFGISRGQCDRTFLNDMTKICKKKSFFSKVACLTAAGLYYKGVNDFGIFNYHKKPESYCGQSWVQGDCL